MTIKSSRDQIFNDMKDNNGWFSQIKDIKHNVYISIKIQRGFKL